MGNEDVKEVQVDEAEVNEVLVDEKNENGTVSVKGNEETTDITIQIIKDIKQRGPLSAPEEEQKDFIIGLSLDAAVVRSPEEYANRLIVVSDDYKHAIWADTKEFFLDEQESALLASQLAEVKQAVILNLRVQQEVQRRISLCSWVINCY